MGDRVRIGELLAAIGAIGLAVSLGLLDWFEAEAFFGGGDVVGAPAYAGLGTVPFDAGALGWFAFASLIVAILAAIVFLLRVLTGRGPERAMLQGPVAYAFGVFALLVLLVRLFIFQPSPSPDAVSGDKLLSKPQFDAATVEVGLLTGAYLGLFFLVLIVAGTWYSMHDERTGSKAAKARTAELLKDVPIRPVPHVPAPPEPESAVVADDAIGTDPSSPSSPASGGPA